jgi:hypothetical protein
VNQPAVGLQQELLFLAPGGKRTELVDQQANHFFWLKPPRVRIQRPSAIQHGRRNLAHNRRGVVGEVETAVSLELFIVGFGFLYDSTRVRGRPRRNSASYTKLCGVRGQSPLFSCEILADEIRKAINPILVGFAVL